MNEELLLKPTDLHLFNEGTHVRLYEALGARLSRLQDSVTFSVWAPNARSVSVVGTFNDWDRNRHPLTPQGSSGIWAARVPGIPKGAAYKYSIHSRHSDYRVEKADPFGTLHETPPKTASIVWDLDYSWSDSRWMAQRAQRNSLDAPLSIYEVHLGSWRASADPTHRWLTYREIAAPLADHVERLGFTHVEFLPLMEHPFYGSWGYQTTGYFAPTSRYGTPQDLMYLIDHLHQRGIGVILDWVPSHFPADEHGLAFFDGTHLYEHSDPRQGIHPEWKSLIFNYARHEVRSFLISNALFWLDKYHIDALRVDAVASMLYLDYGRKEGEWIPNEQGGRENLDSVRFLRQLNEEIYRAYPDVQTIAEESTSWPAVSRPTSQGGLGFGLKWDMGWMNDTLKYFHRDPVHRSHHQDQLTFRMLYAFHENFVLPLSHDEVVYGKHSLLHQMPGDAWQQRANLRLLLAYQTAQPGKKLLFMGAALGQENEWSHESNIDWHLQERPEHAGLQHLVGDLNRLYRTYPALHAADTDPSGFEWIDCSDAAQSILVFLRRGRTPADIVLAAFNFTPVPRYGYRVGAPSGGTWKEILNSDSVMYGGSDVGNAGGILSEPEPCHGRPFSLYLTLPPLAAVFLSPA